MWDYIRNFIFNSNELYNLFIGVLAIIAQNIFLKIFTAIKNLLFVKKHDSIDGFWVSNFDSVYDGNGTNIELYKIRQTMDVINVDIRQYNSKRGKPVKFKATGIIRGTVIALVYYSVSNKSKQVGVINLRHSTSDKLQDILIGYFQEYDVRYNDGTPSKAKLVLGRENFSLSKLETSLLDLVCYYLNLRPFKNFNSINCFISKKGA